MRPVTAMSTLVMQRAAAIASRMDIGVLTVVTALLAVAAIQAAYQWATAPGGMRANPGRAWWAVVVMGTAMTAWFFEASHHQRQQLATDAMLVLSVTPHAEANCQRLTAQWFDASVYDGFVYHDNSDVAHYKRHICKNLAAYARGGHANPSLDQVAAVHLIAHEVMHVNNIWNEAKAECHGVQLNHLVAEALGATPQQARDLQRRYYEEIYPHLRSDYVSSECRAGGALDIHPDREEFP